jgi:hypothetical protein
MKNIRGLLAGLATLALLAGCGQSDPVSYKCAVAREARLQRDLVPGPLARGVKGDFVLENDKLRAIVQKGGRNWYGISQFGGNIIDALPKAASGALLGQDNFEEFVLGTNIESAPNYQSVTVVDAGGENADGSCRPAIVRATGPDDLLDFINGSTAIRSISPLQFPPSADDYDLPFTISTDYTLEAGKRYIRIDTRLVNDSAQDHWIYLVEYLNGSGENEVFQSGYGFGEAFATAPCDSCNFVAYGGHESGSGVSYGLIHDVAGSTSVSVSGVTVFLYGRDILLVATTPEASQPPNPTTLPTSANGPNFMVPANGEITLTRWFAVGDGTVASIVDVRNELVPPAAGVGTLRGRVTDARGPVAGAEVAVLTSGPEGFPASRGPNLRVVNHFRTDADGRFQGTQAAGDYTLRVNVPGRLAATPLNPAVTVTAGQATTQDFTVPAASRLRVHVTDDQGKPVAAKVQLVGAPDPNDPDGGEPLNGEGGVVAAALTIETGVFGDPGADPLPPGVRLAEFSVLDPQRDGPVGIGDTGEHAIEPGTYRLSVSRGPRYSEFTRQVTISAGALTTVHATLAEVVPTPGHIFGDFHVHTINSPDSEVTNRERIATYLAEDLDFFTPSDHDNRMDFSPVIADMAVDRLIATAPSAEVTTFDYGHYNFWPVALETDSPDDELPNEGHSRDRKIAKGSTDWGGQAPLGQDFPSAGYYSLPPAQIYAEAARDPFQPGRQVVRQINHIDWHFGVSAGGLDIDTGVDPPQSGVDPADRRLDPALANLYDDAYDTLELIVGTDGLEDQDEAEGEFYTQNLGDWFNLLNQGRFRTAISNSDTHQRRVTSMQARNLISVPDDLLRGGRADVAAINADPHTVGDAVRRGLSTMTNTPWLRVRVRNATGATAGLEYKDRYGTSGRPLPASSGTVSVDIDVKSPLWAPYDQLLVFVNGETAQHDDGSRGYGLCAPAFELNLADGDFARAQVVVPAAIIARRFETARTVAVQHPGADFWVVVMARGTPGDSPTMFPVYAEDFAPGSDGVAGTVDDIGLRALAVSNPIYVDVDGDGRFDPPGVANTAHPALGCPGGATMPTG